MIFPVAKNLALSAGFPAGSGTMETESVTSGLKF
jgi:hypothetical protein